MRIVICDDEQLIVKQIKDFLLEYFSAKKLSPPDIVEYIDGHALLNDHQKIDLVFLDIEMPGIDGLYLGKKINQDQPTAKIFVITSYIEYLDEAMRFHVYRYLSKPIDKQRLFRNLTDVMLELSCPQVLAGKTIIQNGSQNIIIHFSDIIFVEALRHKTRIMTRNGEIISSKTMTYWIKELSYDCFYQTNRSFIVNMNFVSNFDHDTVYLCHKQFSVLLTNKKYSNFKKLFYRYIERDI